MTKPVKAAKFDWQPEKGTLTVSGPSGENPLIFPLEGLPIIGLQARRFIAGVNANRAREQGRGDLVTLDTLIVETARVQTMQAAAGAYIALIFDPGTLKEFPVSFLTPQLALEVGKNLVEVAMALTTAEQSTPQSRN